MPILLLAGKGTNRSFLANAIQIRYFDILKIKLPRSILSYQYSVPFDRQNNQPNQHRKI